MHLVCMAKLSQQLQYRQSRTERIREQEDIQRQEAVYDSYYQQAKKLQEGDFKGIKSIEEYEQKYNLLDPNIKQFFSTPEQLRQTKAENIQKEKAIIDEKIRQINERIAKKEADIQRLRDKIRERRYHGDQRDNYENAIDDKEEDIKKYQRELNQLLRNYNKVDEGYDASDVINYSQDVARYKGERQEQRRIQEQAQKKINDLIKQGYTPYITQMSNKGKLEEVYISSLRSPEGKFVKIEKINFKVTDTGELKLSELGRTRLEVPFEIGGKQFKANLSQQLYVDTKTGKLTTNLGQLEQTETEVMAKLQEEQRKQAILQYEQEKKNIYLDPDKNIFDATKFSQVYDLPYQTRGTKNEIPTVDYVPKLSSEGGFDIGVGKGLKKLNELTNVLPIYLSYETKYGLLPTFKFDVVPKDNSVKLSDIKKDVMGKLDKKTEDIINKEILQSGIVEELKPKYQTEYTERFKQQYFKDIINEKITQEEAEKQFSESNIAKDIQKRYSEEVASSRAGKFTVGGFKIFGLQTVKGLTSLVPTTVGGTVKTGLAVWGGVKGYQLLTKVPYLLTGTNIALTTYGGYEGFLNPKATPEQKAGGLITFGIGATSLSYQGYKYLKAKNVLIEQKSLFPKGEMTAQQRKFMNNLIKEGTIKAGDKVTLYAKGGRISEQLIIGKRTVITTRLRRLLGIKNIYEGIPTKQILTKSYKAFGYNVVTKERAVDKALKLLKDVGYKDAQAKEVLRYYSPKVIQQSFKGSIKQDLITGEYKLKGVLAIKQPKLLVDSDLGIYTRSAKIKIRAIVGEGKVGTNAKGLQVANTKFKVIDPEKMTIKDFDALTFTKQKGTEEIAMTRKLNSIISEVKNVPYTNVDDFTLIKKLGGRKIISARKGSMVVFDKGRYLDLGEVKLMSLDKGFNKAPLRAYTTEKEFLKAYVKDNVPKTKVAPKKEFSIINKVKDKITEFKIDRIMKSEAGLTNIQSTGNNQGMQTLLKEPTQTAQQKLQLKSLPDILTQVKNTVKNIRTLLPAFKTSTATVLAQMGATASKLNMGQTQNIALDNQIKQILRTDYANVQLQKQLQGQDLGLAQAQTFSMAQLNKMGDINLNTPAFNYNPNINMPDFTIPPFTFPFMFGGKEGQGKKKKKKRKYGELGLLPDFTSRILGLAPERISRNKADRELKRILTGFELRRGAIIK